MAADRLIATEATFRATRLLGRGPRYFSMVAVPDDDAPPTDIASLMPPPESDKWEAVKLLIDRYGANAAIVATQRAEEMLAGGDMEDHAVWLAIRHAVEELQRLGPKDGERVN